MCCKGNCDDILESLTRAKLGQALDGWIDISDFCIPLVFLQKLMAVINGLKRGDRWSDGAFEKLKRLLIATYQHVARDSSPKEKDVIHRLKDIPSFLGGLG